MHQSGVGVEPAQQSSCPDEECRTVYGQSKRTRACGGRPCLNRGNNPPGWFFQAGIVGSTGVAAQVGGDFGLFVGMDDNGAMKVGTYETGTASITSSLGGDIGLLLAFSDASVDNIEGLTLGGNGGLDTPIVDLMVGTEAFQNGSGGVFNIQATIGFEPSAGVFAGAEATVNQTFMQTWFQSGTR